MTALPVRFHTVQGGASILALAVAGDRIFAGTQDGALLVWSLATFELLQKVQAHRSSLLSLYVSADADRLFSCAGDAVVHVWQLLDKGKNAQLRLLYTLYSRYDVGDVFSVVYSAAYQCVYLGAQNTSIQWYDLSTGRTRPQPKPEYHPSRRNHRFFDSTGPTGCASPKSANKLPRVVTPAQQLEIDKEHIVQYAHFGYVYCMVLTKAVDSAATQMLVSGGGDGVINLWHIQAEGQPSREASLVDGDRPVLSLALDGTLLYSCRLEGQLDVWDLDTRQQIRRIQNPDQQDILSISIGHDWVFTGNSAGKGRLFDLHHSHSEWQAHERLVLASATAMSNGRELVITGGSDSCVTVWDISGSFEVPRKTHVTSNEELVLAVNKFISYATISGKPEYAHDCRKGASYLRGLFQQFGADTDMLPTENQLNPIVLARFVSGKPSHQTVLFYGHYDVVAAHKDDQEWRSDPFMLQATNGYLYGRGASDNKGPLLAALFAAADLKKHALLDLDIVFLVEGEEESGSREFESTVKKYKNRIGSVDYILLANSYWLTDNLPCLTYGLRGVIRATLEVQSELPDLHSGIDGSQLISEAMKDAVFLMAALTTVEGTIAVPGFHNSVPSITSDELARYRIIAETLIYQNPQLGDIQSMITSLQARWREPSLTIHQVESSGSANSSVMPRAAKVDFSLRLVPDQTTRQVESSLRAFLSHQFSRLRSANILTLSISHRAEPWLGDPDNRLFQCLDAAVMDAWAPVYVRKQPKLSKLDTGCNEISGPRSPPATSSTLSSPLGPLSLGEGLQMDGSADDEMCKLEKPLYIREGGSIPAVRFLELEFGAPAAHLPCGQASDKAHLANERFRLLNLYKSREIFREIFIKLALAKS